MPDRSPLLVRERGTGGSKTRVGLVMESTDGTEARLSRGADETSRRCLLAFQSSLFTVCPKFRDGNAGASGYRSGSRGKGVVSWTGRAIPSPPHGQSPMGPHLSLGALFAFGSMAPNPSWV